MQRPEIDFQNTHATAVKVLERRYLKKDADGKPVEKPEDMFWRVAQNIAQAESSFESIEQWADTFYKMMVRCEFMPNSPTLMNAGRDLQQLSACFVLPVGDSMEEIFETLKHTALIHKSGGGTGFSFTRLRPKNDRVQSTHGVSSGPVSFMKIFDAATEHVKQGGTRRGANMGILRVDHPDILEFVECKANGGIQNFNISVAITDKFMTAIDNGGEYALINPRDGSEHSKLNAREVFGKIIDLAWKTGDPGLVFIDRINAAAPTPAHGFIEATNPCVTGDTLVMTVDGAVTVRSIVGKQVTLLVNGDEHRTTQIGFYETGVKKVFRLALEDGKTVKLTENHMVMVYRANKQLWVEAKDIKTGDKVRVHDHEEGKLRYSRFLSLIPCGEEMVYDVQVPGVNAFDANGIYVHNCGELPLQPNDACTLGSINVAKFVDENGDIDWVQLKICVQHSVRFLDNVLDMNHYPLPQIADMTRGNRKIGLGVMGFADLLIEMGIPYDSKEAVKVAHNVMGCINDTADAYSRVLGAERGEYPFCEKPEHRGRRNATVTTIAPTGTISMIAGCSSGIEPLFALAYVKNVMDNTPLVETNAAFEATAKAFGFYSDELMRKVAEHGGVHDMDEVPEDVRKVFVTSHDIVPHWHVAIQAAFQAHTENSVSKTINLANSATRTDVREAYEMAWKTGCKGITIYRDGCKDTQVLYTGTKDPNKKPEAVAGTPEVTAHIHPRKRPGVLSGETQKVGTGCGSLYVTVNQEEGQPVEVFAQMGKSGGCATAQTQAITRLASIALRAGVDSKEIAEQLTGIRCPAPQWGVGGMILSCPDGIGKVLSGLSLTAELPMGDKADKLVNNSLSGDIVGMCPDCGHVLEFVEGCSVCKSCGFSKCGG